MTVRSTPPHRHSDIPLGDRPQRSLVMIRLSWANATAPRREGHGDDDQLDGDTSYPHRLQQRAA